MCANDLPKTGSRLRELYLFIFVLRKKSVSRIMNYYQETFLRSALDISGQYCDLLALVKEWVNLDDALSLLLLNIHIKSFIIRQNTVSMVFAFVNCVFLLFGLG